MNALEILFSSVAWLMPVALLAFLVLPAAVRILREYERGVVFRLGKLLRAKGPGLVLLIPFVDRMVRMDLRVVRARSHDEHHERGPRAGGGGRLLAGQHEDAYADDAAQADAGELPQAQHAAEVAALPGFGLQLFDGFVPRERGGKRAGRLAHRDGFPRMDRAIIANRARWRLAAVGASRTFLIDSA